MNDVASFSHEDPSIYLNGTSLITYYAESLLSNTLILQNINFDVEFATHFLI
jgi:hypothetical protein